MTTEQHAFTSAHLVSLAPRRGTLPVCGCGQDLDVVSGTHCPRCGTSVLPHAARAA